MPTPTQFHRTLCSFTFYVGCKTYKTTAIRQTLTLLMVCRSAMNSTHSVRCWRMHSAVFVDSRLCAYGLYWYDARSGTMLIGPSVPPESMHTSYSKQAQENRVSFNSICIPDSQRPMRNPNLWTQVHTAHSETTTTLYFIVQLKILINLNKISAIMASECGF